MDVTNEENFLQNVLEESKKHGNSIVQVEFRDHVIAEIKETKHYKRGKHFGRFNPKK